MTAWKKAGTAPEEISADEPVLVLTWRKGQIGVRPVIGYRTKHDGWLRHEDEGELIALYWAEIPMPFPSPS
jgi:hypothetical protein